MAGRIWCASGPVWASVDRARLEGYLTSVSILQPDGSMRTEPRITAWVEIEPQGALGYQPRLDGKAIGAMPPTHFPAANVNNILLSGVNGNEVATIGVKCLTHRPIVT